jgi:ATPase subunit of ABC transporter with duplicated ATPase domains
MYNCTTTKTKLIYRRHHVFVSHDRMFLRGLGSRVLELGGESSTDRNPTVYPGSYVE